MDRLLTMDKEQYIAEMQAEVRRVPGQVADAVNNAPNRQCHQRQRDRGAGRDG